MYLYARLSSTSGNDDVLSLGTRLATWHDAMVAHERRLRAGTTSDRCDDDCPHAEAQALWREAVTVLGPHASQLTFLRSRARSRRS